ncbi:MAG: hypothetical protein MUP44_04310 [Anaerolineales bacterium]|nr:hypothetical protein [Anaerolineales bacterium]
MLFPRREQSEPSPQFRSAPTGGMWLRSDFGTGNAAGHRKGEIIHAVQGLDQVWRLAQQE